MSNIREEMPVLVRHEGDWKGTYTIVDNEGNIIDKHTSHLTCQFPENAEYPYFQTNRYEWADGKKEEYQFPGISVVQEHRMCSYPDHQSLCR